MWKIKRESIAENFGNYQQEISHESVHKSRVVLLSKDNPAQL